MSGKRGDGMKKEKIKEIIAMSLRKIICYRQGNGKYVIFKHDEENTERVMSELEEWVDVLLKD